ncbi:hypothetical protein LCGC14_1413370 [marine sediment metagenome]|uniref:Uncharacterized protein n=1 Tax=marine sediment metagenome TaxID=412755 RepID=A0A0F9M8Y8_9ZZZZ|nr:hypothetical protein [Candidatus Aminicenantes bacterium]
MDIIYAWKKAKKGQEITRFENGKPLTTDGSGITKETVGSLSSYLSGIDPDWLLADDWEIVKKKKKVVIDVCHWTFCKDNSRVVLYPISESKAFTKEDPHGLEKAKEVTMTLEWEE